MSWNEVVPRYWQRPLGENEALIKMIGDGGHRYGKDTWSISVSAHFRASLEPGSLLEALRDGWKTLRFHHPSLATIARNNIIEYHTPSLLELEQWTDESFVLVEGDSSLSDIIAHLEPRRFATIYYLEKHDTVLLNLSHWRTDGIGAFYLLDAYFRAVSESLERGNIALSWGGEPSRLVPSVEQALGIPHNPTREIERAAKQYLATLANNTGALSTPYRSGAGVVPKGTRSTSLRFCEKETKKLYHECERLDIPLEAAIHASVSATAYSVADQASQHKHHSSTLRQSLRPHLPPPYNREAGAAGIYTAGYIVKVPSSQTWLQNARQYAVEYSKGADSDLLCSRRQYALEMTALLKGMTVPLDNPPSGLDVSYVPGVQNMIKPVYRSESSVIEICDVAIGVDVTSRHLYVFVWIFQDRLGLQLVYNEAYYDRAFVESILPTLKKHMVANLWYGEIDQ